MAAKVKQLSIDILSSDIVGTTFTLDFGFAPTALLLIWNGRSIVNSIGRQDIHVGRGWAVSTTARAFTVSLSRDNTGSSISKRVGNQTGCMGIASDSATDGILDLDALLGNGARFIIDEQFAVDIHVDILALGGDINQAFAGTELLPTGGTVPRIESVIGVGFSPECVLFMSAATGTDGQDNDSQTSFGAMVSATDQGCISGASKDNSASMATARYARHGDIAHAVVLSTGFIDPRFQFSSFDPDGFSYNYLERNPDLVYFLALAGGDYAIKEFLTKLDGTDIDVTVGFRSAGGIVLSACTTEPADNDTEATPKKEVQAEGIWSSADGVAFDQAAGWAYDEDSLGTSRAATAQRNDAVYVRGTEVAAPAVDGQMSVKSVGPTITTFVMDNPDPSAAMAFGIFFGPGVLAGEVQVDASIEVSQNGEVQVVASVEVKQNGEKTADASINVEQNGQVTADASINVTLEQSGEVQVSSSVEVKQNGDVQVVSSVEVEQNGAVQATASIAVVLPSPPMGGGGSDFVTRTSSRADRVLKRIRRRP